MFSKKKVIINKADQGRNKVDRSAQRYLYIIVPFLIRFGDISGEFDRDCYVADASKRYD